MTMFVHSMIADITAGKTAIDEKTGLRGRAIVTGGATTAARVADLLSGIMAWAVEQGLARTQSGSRRSSISSRATSALSFECRDTKPWGGATSDEQCLPSLCRRDP